ncbi:MAG: beta-hydroxyacyl-ACP dehydratase [Planctomycetota bacterium]|nr:beta-hydroxyacyl-ACP dehydratase [Planctomycetota bacterium]
MRWYWLDRFEKFVAGEEAISLKNVTLAEESLDDYLPGYAHYPHSLIIEGMAQTGGILLSQTNDFRDKIVLAKVSKAEFDCITRPGDTIRLRAVLVNRQADGAIVEGSIEVNDEPQGRMELTFAILDESYGSEPFFIPSDFCRVLRGLCLFDVGVNPDGSPLQIPEEMLAAEIDALTTPCE